MSDKYIISSLEYLAVAVALVWVHSVAAVELPGPVPALPGTATHTVEGCLDAEKNKALGIPLSFKLPALNLPTNGMQTTWVERRNTKSSEVDYILSDAKTRWTLLLLKTMVLHDEKEAQNKMLSRVANLTRTDKRENLEVPIGDRRFVFGSSPGCGAIIFTRRNVLVELSSHNKNFNFRNIAIDIDNEIKSNVSCRGAINFPDVLLSVNGSHEIGDRIPVDVTLLVDNLKCSGDLEFKIGGKKRLDFNVTGPDGRRLRPLSDKRISVLSENQWITLTNRLTRVAEVDLAEIYCEPYVSRTPHDFNVTGMYHITCSIDVSVRARNAAGAMSQRRMSSKEYPLEILPVTSNSLEKSWSIIENGEYSNPTEVICALVKIQYAPKELSHDDISKLKAVYNKTISEAVKTHVLRLIGARGPTGGVDLIANILLTEKSPFVRSEAIGALIGYDSEKARKVLVEEVTSRRERSYRAAIVVLGHLGREDCIDALNEVAKTDEVDWVRARANESIMQIRARLNHAP